MANEHWLNINQSPEDLKVIYKDKDFYSYLRSPEFVKAFLRPIGGFLWAIGAQSVLDVACGNGQLKNALPPHIRYWGFDASEEAIRQLHSDIHLNGVLRVGRMEDPPTFEVGARTFDSVVFGGVMEVLIKPEYRVDLCRLYVEKYGPKHLIIYDLLRLEEMAFRQQYGEPVIRYVAAADQPDPAIPEVKLYRKVLVFKC